MSCLVCSSPSCFVKYIRVRDAKNNNVTANQWVRYIGIYLPISESVKLALICPCIWSRGWDRLVQINKTIWYESCILHPVQRKIDCEKHDKLWKGKKTSRRGYSPIAARLAAPMMYHITLTLNLSLALMITLSLWKKDTGFSIRNES